MYYEIWAQFDPDGTQYIRYDQLSDFLDVLEPPLQIHKPNRFKVISMDISICKGDMMYCVDILDALTRDFFARKGIYVLLRCFHHKLLGTVNVSYLPFLYANSRQLHPN